MRFDKYKSSHWKIGAVVDPQFRYGGLFEVPPSFPTVDCAVLNILQIFTMMKAQEIQGIA